MAAKDNDSPPPIGAVPGTRPDLADPPLKPMPLRHDRRPRQSCRWRRSVRMEKHANAIRIIRRPVNQTQVNAPASTASTAR